MSDIPRDVRDRLGEALRQSSHARLNETPSRQWSESSAHVRGFWMTEADRVIDTVASCGLKIVPDDDGETK